MPVLGIVASQISGHLTSPSYYSIATNTVGAGGASSITFSSIPSTYTHLQIRISELNTSSTASDLKITFNSDTGSNYTQHYGVYGSGTGTAGSAATTPAAYLPGALMGSTTAPAASIVDILDYTNTNKYTTVRGLCGVDINGAGGYIFFNSGAWLNTAAITSITLTPYAGTIQQYSSAALYGIKGA